MGDRTAIGWTEATWNPVTGCSRVSPGCDHCYAERQVGTRLRNLPAYAGLTGPEGEWTGEVRFLPDRLDQPLRWRRPRRIFVNSMSDLFHPGVPDDVIATIWEVMGAASQHQFQVLTKRPQRMAEWVTRATTSEWPLPNVWAGTSIESQRYAFRARHLLDTPAAVRFVSAEPLLGPLDLRTVLRPAERPAIDWVIVGGESGPRYRPMDEDWARGLRDQCAEAGVAFFYKQAAGFRSGTPGPADLDRVKEYPA